jgi:hypothetical protein
MPDDAASLVDSGADLLRAQPEEDERRSRAADGCEAR